MLLPGLPVAKPVNSDLRVFFGIRPPNQAARSADWKHLILTSSMTAESGEPVFRIFSEGDLINLVYCDHTEFWLDGKSHNIWCTWQESVSFGDVAAYLLGPVLGCFLRGKGTTCLHASAISHSGKAVLFVGDSGAGKSTTMAAMAQRGHAVLSDDIVAITESDGIPLATPSYPSISLLPDSVQMLYGPKAKLHERTPYCAKTQLALVEATEFEDSPIPVGLIFILAERSSESGLPSLQRLTLQESLIALVINSYGTRVLGRKERSREFELFGRIARSVKIVRLRPHTRPALLDELCDLIEDECRKAISRETPSDAQLRGLDRGAEITTDKY